MIEYLRPKDLANRYGISLITLQQWRKKTRKGEATGPPFEDIGLTPLKPYAPRIRYRLVDVIEWEAKNNITPNSTD